MYLKKVKNKKTGKIYLSIAQSYRDNSSKYPKATTIKSLGYLDELEKKYEISFLKKLNGIYNLIYRYVDILYFIRSKIK